MLTLHCIDETFSLDSISPRSGPNSGSTLLTVFGGPFASTTEAVVQFTDSNNVVYNFPATVVSSGAVVCNTSAIPFNGTVTVSLSLNGQQFVSSAITFLVYCTSTTSFCRSLCVLIHLCLQRAR